MKRTQAVLGMLMLLPALGSARGSEKRASSGLMTVPEIYKAMGASPVRYDVKELAAATDVDPADLVDVMYPLSVRPVELPQVHQERGARVIGSAPCAAAKPVMAEAESLFSAKNYPAAGKLYQQAVTAAPQCYIAYAFRGDAAFFQGQYEVALADYDRALALDPDDGSIYVYRANALQHLNRYPEMLEALRTSLALRPRNSNVITMLKQAERPLHLVVRDVGVQIHGFARSEGASIAVYADPHRLPWMAYAVCKGFWLGEPDHRKKLTGSSEHHLSSMEELECLNALLSGYEQGKAHSDSIEEPELSLVMEITRAGMGSEWLIYEWMSRADPQIVLRLPLSERKRMLDFVRRFVAVDDAPVH